MAILMRVLAIPPSALAQERPAQAQSFAGPTPSPVKPAAPTAADHLPAEGERARASDAAPVDLTDSPLSGHVESGRVIGTSGARTGASSAAGLPAPKIIDDTHEARASAGRDGFYFRLSTGLSFVSVRGTGPNGNARVRGIDTGGFALAVGGTMVPGVAIAGVIQDFANASDFRGGPFDDATITSGDGRSRKASRMALADFLQLGVLVDWYPLASAGLHAGAMGGVGVLGLTNHADGSNMFGYGVSGGVFGGYDWPIANRWMVGVEISAVVGGSLSMKNDDAKRSDAGYNLTPAAVGLRGTLAYY